MVKRDNKRGAREKNLESAAAVLKRHFAGLNVANLITSNREYPAPARVDLQRELMRRAAQFLLDSKRAHLQPRHIDAALQEMLFSGGSPGRRNLGSGSTY
jgi:hypothetical protein